MHTQTHNISPTLTNLHPSTPISPHPLVIPYQSPSEPIPNTQIRQNPRGSVSTLLNKQTQFHNHKMDLILCLTTTYINPCLPSRHETNPFSAPHPTLLISLRLCLSASLRAKACQGFRTQTSRSNSAPGFPPLTKPVSTILNERTQFLTPRTPLNLCPAITYITRLPPAPKNTNPILNPHPQPAPASEPNPIQTHTEPIPNPIRTRPRAVALHTSCPSSHTTPLFPVQNHSKSAQKLQKTAQKPFKTAKNCSKRAQNAPLIDAKCASPLRENPTQITTSRRFTDLPHTQYAIDNSQYTITNSRPVQYIMSNRQLPIAFAFPAEPFFWYNRRFQVFFRSLQSGANTYLQNTYEPCGRRPTNPRPAHRHTH